MTEISLHSDDELPLIYHLPRPPVRQVRFAEHTQVTLVPRSSDDEWEDTDADDEESEEAEEEEHLYRPIPRRPVQPQPSIVLSFDPSAFEDVDPDPNPPPSYTQPNQNDPPPPTYQSIYDSLQLQQDGKRVLHVYLVTLLFIGLYLFLMSGAHWNPNLSISNLQLAPSNNSNANEYGKFVVPLELEFEMHNLYAANFTPVSVGVTVYRTPNIIGQGGINPVPSQRTLVKAHSKLTMKVPVWIELGNDRVDPGHGLLRRVLWQCQKHKQNNNVHHEVSILIWFRVRGILNGHGRAVGISEMKTVTMKQCWIPANARNEVLEKVKRQEEEWGRLKPFESILARLGSDGLTLGGIGNAKFLGRG